MLFFESFSSVAPARDDDDLLVFSFRDLQPEYSFDANCCDDKLRKDLLTKLTKMCRTTWEDLQRLGKKSGFESLERSAIKVPLPSCVTDDVNKLHVIRFHGQSARLIGYRLGAVFYVLFIDAELKLYKH